MLRSEFIKTLTLSGITCLIPEIEKYQTDIVDTILMDMSHEKISDEFVGKFVGYEKVPHTPTYPLISSNENPSLEELLREFEAQSDYEWSIGLIDGIKHTFSSRNKMNNFLWEKINKSNLGLPGCNIISTQNRFMMINRCGNTGWILNPHHEDINLDPKFKNYIKTVQELSSTDTVCYCKHHFTRSPGWYIKRDDSYTVWMAPDRLNYLGRFTRP